MESLTAGTLAGTGSFRCEQCGYVLTLAADDTLPACPSCGEAHFVRASLFPGGRFARDKGKGAAPADQEAFLAEARELVTAPGEHLAFRDGDTVRVLPLTREWTRIGRSLAADIRFDDATVSRRHALVVRQPDGVRVLDDRSLNGIFVNGHRVEWRTLHDGDEVVVGGTAALPRRREGPRRRRLSPRGPPGPACDPPGRGNQDRSPLPEGRDREDDRGPHPDRRPAPRGPEGPGGRPGSAGQPLGLLRRRPGRRPDDRRRARGPAPRPSRPCTTTSCRRTSPWPRPS
jgi:predicted  nucleic acid-binding Zn-ribbon protein